MTLDNLAGMGWERPVLGAAMWTFMLGFAGLPPTGGFLGKFYVFSAAYDARLALARDRRRRRDRGQPLLLPRRHPGALHAPERRSSSSPPAASRRATLLLQVGVIACVVVTVGSFFAVQPLIDLATKAVSSL